MLTEQDIQKLKKNINHALQDGKTGTLTDCLNQLSEWTATVDVLKRTEIGVFINKIRKDPKMTDRLSTLCKDLVLKWKKDVQQSSKPSTDKSEKSEKTAETNKEDKANTDTERSAVESDSNTKDDSTSVSETPSIQQEPAPKERTVSSDNVTYKSTSSKIRDKCIELFYKGLASETFEDSSLVISKAIKIEHHVHQRYTEKEYQSRIRSMYQNLVSQPQLKASILRSRITEEEFAKMTKEEMASDEFKKAAEEAIKQNMSEAMTAQPVVGYTDQFKCGKCKGRKTSYYQMQTRSADEPMTTFVKCLICDNRWKFC